MSVTETTLLEVAEAKAAQINQWRRGVRIEADTRLTIDQLRVRATVDRWRLASECERRGQRLMRSRPPMYRDAISRFYYAMYHGTRALVYFVTEGDDHEEHRVLPGKLPDNFRDKEVWTNNLKDARETRNRADYDAYPTDDAAWRDDAVLLQARSAELLGRVRAYLEARGCVFP